MNLFTLKNVAVLLIVITLLSGIVIGVRLVQQQTQLQSKAATICEQAYDGQTLQGQTPEVIASFQVAECGDSAVSCQAANDRWIREHNAELAKNPPKATDSQTLFDQTCGVIYSFYREFGGNAPQEWVKQHNAAIATPPSPTPTSPPPSPTPLPTAQTCAQGNCSACRTITPCSDKTVRTYDVCEDDRNQRLGDANFCKNGAQRFRCFSSETSLCTSNPQGGYAYPCLDCGLAGTTTPTPGGRQPTPTPGGGQPTPTPGGGQPTPTPGGPAGSAEGSECQYEILDPTTLQRASRIETRKDYTVKLTMTNKAAQDSGVVWKQGQYKLTSTPQTQTTWGTKAAYELAESQQGQDVRPGGSLLFQIPIKAPAIGQNPESKSFYFVMAKDGVAFGAACQPQDVIVHPPAREVVSTLCYAISENSTEVSSVSSCDLTNPTIHPYTDNPITYSFRDTTPGLKTIYVKFFDNNNRPSNIFTKNVLLSPDPSITNADCRHLTTGVGTQITITGTNFGVQGRGKLKVGGTDVLPTTWTSNTITASVDQRLEGNVPLVVTIDDGRQATGSCSVNTTSFTFTAKNQCRLAGQYSLDNVEVKIYELGTEPILRQTTKLDKDGKPQAFVPKLEKNKNYTMVIKAPGVLAKKVNVPVTGGTVNVEPFTLLSGDIYPKGSPDGKVNAFDTSELKREWSLVTDVVRDGDLNGDSRVNSIDYSCMLQNINKEDEIFTPPVITTPTPVPTVSGSPTPTPSLTPTPQPTPAT